MWLWHSGTHSYIDNWVGNLYIRQGADDGDIVFQCDDGSGGLATYFELDGSDANGVKTTNWPDNSKITIGTSNDLQIYHNASSSLVDNYVGDIKIRNYADDKDITFQCDDGNGGLAEYFRLDGSEAAYSGGATTRLVTKWLDKSICAWGAGLDLRISHNGTNSLIDNYDGDLKIFQQADDKDIILLSDDGSGGTTAYITCDGSAETVVVSKTLVQSALSYIKILPSDFVADEGGGANKSAQYDATDAGGGTVDIGASVGDTDALLYAFVDIPVGKTATHVTVYGSNTGNAITVYESNIATGTLTSKGSGSTDTGDDAEIIDITDVAGTATNYLVISSAIAAITNTIWGGVITLADS